jgi:hypothetical protein
MYPKFNQPGLFGARILLFSQIGKITVLVYYSADKV